MISLREEKTTLGDVTIEEGSGCLVGIGDDKVVEEGLDGCCVKRSALIRLESVIKLLQYLLFDSKALTALAIYLVLVVMVQGQ